VTTFIIKTDNKKLLAFVTLLSCLLGSIQAYAQITRGAVPGEIYMSSDWYADTQGVQYGIFYSNTHGQYLRPQFNSLEIPPPDEMIIGKVLGDASFGALYNWGNNELWVSFDYGESWISRGICLYNSKFFSGVNDGVIIKGNSNGLFKSTNFADTFEVIPIIVTCPFTEEGFSENEFFGITSDDGSEFNFVHTIDYGESYSEVSIPPEVTSGQVGGYYPQISRGTEPGELYLVSWWPDNNNYKIFHSIDTGYTWTEQYESEYIDTYYWRVSYTAGREPCSFYVTRSRITPDFDHVWLYIDYSSDCGQTFTTYFHDLVADYTGIENTKLPENTCISSPNPFSTNTTIKFNSTYFSSKAKLNIYTINGILIKQYSIFNKSAITWNGTDANGKTLANGVYLYHIIDDQFIYPFNKLIINH
jgi:hypothetical protein